MGRRVRLLLVGLLLAAVAGCKKDASPVTPSGRLGPMEHTKESPKLIPLPK
jgi:hypothetical protein